MATGASMKAAVQAVKQAKAQEIIIAVPCAAQDTCQALAQEVTVICCHMPAPFIAVGRWYQDFSQTSDQEVRTLLAQNTARDI
jgi:predicted phosphoribosyltransferase